MSSKEQPRSVYNKRTEQQSGLSRHYRQIGIKAVVGATRKQQTRDSMPMNRKRPVQKEDTINEDSASRMTRESFNNPLETGPKTVQGLQEGFMSALENVRDLNVRLIAMAQANSDAAFDFAREFAEAKAPSDLVQAWTTHAIKQFDMLTKRTPHQGTKRLFHDGQ